MEETTYRSFEGKLAFYHPTAAGTGCAVQFELRPASRGRDGCLFAEFAAQKTVAERSDGGRKGATFDWPARVAIKLGFGDACALLAVLEGKASAAGGEKGLYHESREATTMIGFRRVEEPVAGFSFEVSRKGKGPDAGQPVRHRIVLSEAEGCGLRHVLGASMFHLCFHEAILSRPAVPETDDGG
jgi:hypothetical protein